MATTITTAQRSAQSDMRAATASLAALGRAASTVAVGAGGMTEHALYNVNGRWWREWVDPVTLQERWQDCLTGRHQTRAPLPERIGHPEIKNRRR